MSTLNIMSIFFSISGEINMWPQGTPVVFVRLAGCNLNCSYCDTPDSINATGTKNDIQEIIDIISNFDCKRVLITGGEPLLQQVGLATLITVLKRLDYDVSIETNGSLSLWGMHSFPDCWVVDIKMPSSGHFDDMFKNGRLISTSAVDRAIYKIPIENKEDFDCAAEVIKTHINTDRDMVALSPVWPLTAAQLWDLMLANKLTDCVLNTQIHKQIWPNSNIER